MNSYDPQKLFHHDRRLQFYMYAFMYVYPETMTVEEYFPATKVFFENYKKISTAVPVPKHWLGFSYIC